MRTLSGPLHICCVCFSELFKRQKTKSKEKGRECAMLPFLFFFLFHFFRPGKEADSVTLFSCFILFRRCRSLFISPFSPSTIFFYFSQSVFPPCFERARKASLSLSDLIFLCNSHSRWPGKLPWTKEQRNECTDPKESKTREDRGRNRLIIRDGSIWDEGTKVEKKRHFWWVKVDLWTRPAHCDSPIWFVSPGKQKKQMREVTDDRV